MLQTHIRFYSIMALCCKKHSKLFVHNAKRRINVYFIIFFTTTEPSEYT